MCALVQNFQLVGVLYQTVWFHGKGPLLEKLQSKSATSTYGTEMLCTLDILMMVIVVMEGGIAMSEEYKYMKEDMIMRYWRCCITSHIAISRRWNI
jgi:hypothetical protein